VPQVAALDGRAGLRSVHRDHATLRADFGGTLLGGTICTLPKAGQISGERMVVGLAL